MKILLTLLFCLVTLISFSQTTTNSWVREDTCYTDAFDSYSNNTEIRQVYKKDWPSTTGLAAVLNTNNTYDHTGPGDQSLRVNTNTSGTDASRVEREFGIETVVGGLYILKVWSRTHGSTTVDEVKFGAVNEIDVDQSSDNTLLATNTWKQYDASFNATSSDMHRFFFYVDDGGGGHDAYFDDLEFCGYVEADATDTIKIGSCGAAVNHSGTDYDFVYLNADTTTTSATYTVSGATTVVTNPNTSLDGQSFNLGITTVQWDDGNGHTFDQIVKVYDEPPTFTKPGSIIYSDDMEYANSGAMRAVWNVYDCKDYALPGSEGIYKIHTLEEYEGSKSIKMDYNGGTPTKVQRNDINLEAGKTYTFSIWIVNERSNNKNNYIGVNYPDGTFLDSYGPFTVPNDGDNGDDSDWRQISVTFRATIDGNYQVWFETSGHGSDTSWDLFELNEEITYPPADSTINTACNYDFGDNSMDAIGWDACDGDIPATYTLSGATTVIDSPDSTLENQHFNDGVTTVTWTAEDSNGETTTYTNTITVNIASGVEYDAIVPTHVTTNGGSDGSINTTFSSGNTPYVFSWNPDQGDTEDPSSLSAGTYYVTVTDDDGCTATASTELTEPIALPVEFLSFEGEWEGRMVRLHWQTATEQNSSHFDVMRNDDGIWEIIATVVAGGNSNVKLDYVWYDEDPSNEDISYYRLKQFDYDSKFDYSDIISIHLKRDYDMDLHIYPNPIEGDLEFMVTSDEDKEVVILVYDNLGRDISFMGKVSLSKGENNLNINVKNLSNSLHSLVLVTEESTYVEKFIK